MKSAGHNQPPQALDAHSAHKPPVRLSNALEKKADTEHAVSAEPLLCQAQNAEPYHPRHPRLRARGDSNSDLLTEGRQQVAVEAHLRP